MIGKAKMAVFAQDHMIQEGNAQEFCALAQPLREDVIFLAGRGITGRMVMGTDTRSSIHQD